MQQYTYENLVEMGPCWLDEEGGEDRLRAACDRLGGTFSIVDVLQANWLDAEDRIWVATQDGVLPARTLRLFVARTVRRCLDHERATGREPDPRSWAAIDTAERHARGQATDEELDAAATEAAAAVWARAWKAAVWARALAARAWKAAAVAAAEWAVSAAAAADARVAEAEAAERQQQVVDLLDLLGAVQRVGALRVVDGGRE